MDVWTEEELAERWRTSVPVVPVMTPRSLSVCGAITASPVTRHSRPTLYAHEHPVDPFGSKPFTGPLAHGSVAS